MALTGNNGDNETNIGLSRSLSFNIYDENNNEIKVNNQQKPIEFWISRDQTVEIEPFELIDALNATYSNNDDKSLANSSSLIKSKLVNGFMVSGFNLTTNGSTRVNRSIHIQIKPNNKSISYLTLLKFGDNPNLQLNNKYYDLLNIYCPNDLINDDQNHSFYLIFANMSKVYSFNNKTSNGYIGFSIIEISNLNNLNLYCQNKSFNSSSVIDLLIDDLIQNQNNKTTNNNSSSFTDNYSIRIYSSGCYYMNTQTNEWSSYGMEILYDTNITHTHCISNHLTTFAGGFIVLPATINFNNVWANASFLQNPVIYSTVIALISLYILLAIWSRYMDSKDSKKIGIYYIIFG